MPATVKSWNVRPLSISRFKRHADATVVEDFWTQLEQYLEVKKPFLLPKREAE